MLPSRVAVLGIGLIGGSVALGTRARVEGVTVVGYDEDARSASEALSRGAIDEVASSAAAAVGGAAMIVVAAPVDQIPQLLTEISSHVGDDASVTDVGSAKAEVVRHGVELLGGRFVGGHPMAGSERHGIEAADPELFDGASWILTPTPETSSTAYSSVVDLVSALGAKPVAVDPVAHDALVARLSHLPQLTASALVEVAVSAGDRDTLLGLAAQGFRDVTRIAASHPEVWVGILRLNKSAVLEALAGLGSRLDHVAQMIAEDRWGELRVFLERARIARMGLFAKPSYGGDPVALSMMIPDRPGVLAEVTTAAGRLGANIEDLRIIHSTEGGGGRLELVVAGQDRAELLMSALKKIGYHVQLGHFE